MRNLCTFLSAVCWDEAARLQAVPDWLADSSTVLEAPEGIVSHAWEDTKVAGMRRDENCAIKVHESFYQGRTYLLSLA